GVMKGVGPEGVTAVGARPERTAIHFHGGGYCIGSSLMVRTWAAHLSAQAACRVVVPEYRLAPADPYPAALSDARDVLHAVLGEAAPGSGVVSGDSAGGGPPLSPRPPLPPRGTAPPPGSIL